jgi:MFS family permease
VTETRLDRSYRALLAVPSLGRALLGMQVARVGQAMVGVAMVLFALQRYGSPALAGLITFVSIAPGILVSPIAGALLDRHGRVYLIVADFIVALASLALIGVLALLDLLPIWLLLLIAGVSSLTQPLSGTGLRSLFPLMAPRHLWERLNAIDSNGYVVATILGPPVAAVGVSVIGGPATLILIGLLFGVSALILIRVPEPDTQVVSTGRILRDAWAGLVYTWRNRSLRAIGFSITTLNIAGGMSTIVVPVIVLNELHLGEAAVGAVFAMQGVAGMIAGLYSGRLETLGRERRLIAIPMLLMAPATALLFVASPWAVVLSYVILGVLNGPLDVAMFTLRQRRTEQAWMGRAFAVSMSFNFAGYPIGSALGGALAAVSIPAAIGLGVVACLVAAVLAFRLIPAHG